MIINTKIINDIEISSLEDLSKLRPLMENKLIKLNLSRISREMGVDPRTVKKYIGGFEKKKTRVKKSKLDAYYRIMVDLLESKTQRFYYKRNLYHYLTDVHKLDVPEPTFRYYLKRHPELDSYFNEDNPSNAQGCPIMRYETAAGQQAQLDWKETMEFVLKDTGEVIVVNIFVLILSYSRFRVYRLSLNKTQDALLHFLTESFETFGGVPHEILTDNMKTVMNESRTEYSKGVVNAKFDAYAKDMGFEVKPCAAATPKTKSKVESPMKILDELRAYSGTLNYVELCDKLEYINNRENTKINDGTGLIPLNLFEKEKGSLLELPNEKVRNQYKIKTSTLIVNNSSMINYKRNQYSVPIKYKGTQVECQVEDPKLYIYFNTKLIAVHIISDKKLNYNEDHYFDVVKSNLKNESNIKFV